MFAFTTSSSIPMTSATVGATSVNGSSFNVYPLVGLDSHWNNVSSAHTVTIRDSSSAVRSSSFDAEAVQSGVPAALWGSPPEDASGKPQVPDADKLLVPEPVDRRLVRVKPPAVGQFRRLDRRQCEPDLRRAEAAVGGAAGERLGPPGWRQPSNSGVTISRDRQPSERHRIERRHGRTPGDLRRAGTARLRPGRERPHDQVPRPNRLQLERRAPARQLRRPA